MHLPPMLSSLSANTLMTVRPSQPLPEVFRTNLYALFQEYSAPVPLPG
jgi:hypothetical protein